MAYLAVTPSRNAVLQKVTYPGLAVVLCIPIQVAIGYYDRYFYRVTFWRVDVEGLISSSLLVLAICLGYSIATRRLRWILLAIPAAAIIGVLSYKAGRLFMAALFPSEYEVAFGAFGQYIERHCSVTFGCNMGDLAASFIAKIGMSVFIGSSTRTMRSFLGGVAGGLVFSALAFAYGFFVDGGMTVDGPFQLALAVLFSLPFAFAWGAMLSASILLGQTIGLNVPCRNALTAA